MYLKLSLKSLYFSGLKLKPNGNAAFVLNHVWPQPQREKIHQRELFWNKRSKKNSKTDPHIITIMFSSLMKCKNYKTLKTQAHAKCMNE